KPPKNVKEVREMFDKQQDKYSSNEFWKLIYSLLLQGKTKEVKGLLDEYFEQKQKEIFKSSMDIEEEDNVFKFIDDLLFHSPISKLHPRASLKDYLGMFSQWQQDCRECLETYEQELYDHNAEQLINVLKILIGDEN